MNVMLLWSFINVKRFPWRFSGTNLCVSLHQNEWYVALEIYTYKNNMKLKEQILKQDQACHIKKQYLNLFIFSKKSFWVYLKISHKCILFHRKKLQRTQGHCRQGPAAPIYQSWWKAYKENLWYQSQDLQGFIWFQEVLQIISFPQTTLNFKGNFDLSLQLIVWLRMQMCV